MPNSALATLELDPPHAQQRELTFYRCRDSNGAEDTSPMSGHDMKARAVVARQLADVLGYRFGGESGPNEPPAPGSYVVPSDTLCLEEAGRLGIAGPQDLFGGVVPHPFVATKLVTHGLVSWLSEAPDGWAPKLGRALGDCVLPGHSVFDRHDALEAGRRLLLDGPVRLKEACGVGGSGQSVATTEAELEAQLESIGAARLGRGFVIERNLQEVSTCSVGHLRVGRWTVSYAGKQRNTRNHHGREVYGGSSLVVVPGGFEELMRTPLAAQTRIAIEQARRYHEAMHDAFGEMFASRCNYDVAQGRDAGGRWHSGVLEQSWRIGGCSGAEVAALHALKEHDGRVVRASTHEIYGDVAVPQDAWVLYDGTDARAGRIVKYAQVHELHRA